MLFTQGGPGVSDIFLRVILGHLLRGRNAGRCDIARTHEVEMCARCCSLLTTELYKPISNSIKAEEPKQGRKGASLRLTGGHISGLSCECALWGAEFRPKTSDTKPVINEPVGMSVDAKRLQSSGELAMRYAIKSSFNIE